MTPKHRPTGAEREGFERDGFALPVLDVAPRRAELIRRRAHAILRAEQAAPPVGSLAWRYQRRIEPALLVGLGLCQAIWVLHGTWSLFH